MRKPISRAIAVAIKTATAPTIARPVVDVRMPRSSLAGSDYGFTAARGYRQAGERQRQGTLGDAIRAPSLRSMNRTTGGDTRSRDRKRGLDDLSMLIVRPGWATDREHEVTSVAAAVAPADREDRSRPGDRRA